jgi:hypothetical protein
MVKSMTEAHKRPNRHPNYKTAYRVKNWAEYDQALRDRGDITLWISQDATEHLEVGYGPSIPRVTRIVAGTPPLLCHVAVAQAAPLQRLEDHGTIPASRWTT